MALFILQKKKRMEKKGLLWLPNEDGDSKGALGKRGIFIYLYLSPSDLLSIPLRASIHTPAPDLKPSALDLPSILEQQTFQSMRMILGYSVVGVSAKKV